MEEGLGGMLRVGEAWLETSSALPSRDSDKRTLDWDWLEGGCDGSEEHEEGGYGSNLRESSPPRPMVDGVEKELPRFHRFDSQPTELDMELDSEREAS